MKPKPYFFFFFLLVIGFLVYLPVLNTTFFADDFYVLNRLQSGTFSAGNLFRPLSDMSIYLDYKLWGNKPLGFHITSVLLHIITSFFVYSVFLALNNFLQTRLVTAHRLAMATGILFLLYPFHNEAVVWIVGRGIVLAALCCLLSLRLYLHTSGNKLYFGGALLFYFIALFGYESVLLFPVMLLALELTANKGKLTAGVIKKITPFVLVLVVYLAIRVYFIGDLVGASDYFRITVSPFDMLVNLFRLVERSFIFPLKDYRLAIVLASSLFFIAFAIAMYKRSTIKPQLPVLRLWIILYLLAVLPFVTLGIDTHTTEGERFLYFSSIFFIFLLVFYIHVLAHSIKLSGMLLLILTGYFCWFLFRSNNNWRKSSTIISAITSGGTGYNSEGNLYIIDLPDNINGALILRNGFAESFNVLGRPLQVKQAVKILSRMRLDNGTPVPVLQRRSQYSVQAGGRFTIRKSAGTWVIYDNQQREEYIVYPADKVFFFNGITLEQLVL